MITIDGRRYLSLKAYSELINVTPSRVSQLKSTLPIEHFPDLNMDLIDFDRLKLAEEVRKGAEAEFANREPLSTYTLPDLGEYFQSLLIRLLKKAEQADQLREQAEENLRRAREENEQQKHLTETVQKELTQAQTINAELETRVGELLASEAAARSRIDESTMALQTENEILHATNTGLQLAVSTLEGVLGRINGEPAPGIGPDRIAAAKSSGKTKTTGNKTE